MEILIVLLVWFSPISRLRVMALKSVPFQIETYIFISSAEIWLVVFASLIGTFFLTLCFRAMVR